MRLSLAVACVATGLALSFLVRADEKPASSAEAKATELFDGKSLKNWKVPEFGADGKVTVKDGELVMGQGDPMTGVTWAGEELPKVDYEVTFEAKRIEGSDFFGTITFPVQKDSCSFVLGGWGGGVIGLSTLDGNSAVENETTGYYDFEKGKWYKVRIRVTKTKIEVWIDDKSVVDVDYSDKRIGIRIEVDLSKPLGFTTYRTTGALRSIKLTKLNSDEKSGK
ncbi:MAG: DUF1080 domain-containing protein [Planctomycetaceae bacterium]